MTLERVSALTPESKKLDWVILVVGSFIVIASCIVASFNPMIGIIVGVGTILISFLFISKNASTVIPAGFILAHYSLFLQDKEISLFEYAFLSLLGLLAINYIFSTVIKRNENIIQYKEDFWILLFFIYSFFLFPIAIVNGNDGLIFFRELIPFVIIISYLFYRPFIKVNPNLHNMLIGAFLLLATIVAFKNIISYQTSIAVAQYYWEITGKRKALSEPLFFSASVMLTGLFFSVKNIKLKAIVILLWSISIVALILTFTRSYWLGYIISIGILFFYLPRKNKKQLLITLLIVIVLVIVASLLFLPSTYVLIMQSVLDRLLTIKATTTTDLSFLNRVEEWKSVMKWIIINPIVGYGYGAVFSFHDILIHTQNNTSYSHNLYLYLLHKSGVVGLIIMIMFYFSVLKSGLNKLKLLQWGTEKSLVLSILILLFVFLIISNSSPQLIQKDSTMIVMIGIVYLQNVGINKQKIKI